MAKEDLLKHANDQKPTDFTNEFKAQLDTKIQAKLFPEEPDVDDTDESGDDE